MTFKPSNYHEIDLLKYSYLHMSRHAKIQLKKSWADPFSKAIFTAINEECFNVFYHEDNGRPPTPINYVLAALIIKGLHYIL